jgi:amidase
MMNSKFTTRRDFLKSTIAAAAAAPMLQVQSLARPGVSSFALDEITSGEMRKGLENGKFTARKLAELYLERIKQIDRSGPTLNSVMELNPDALAIADQLDAERRAKKVRGPLHGIPILIKDNIATADKMQTTAGSLALV